MIPEQARILIIIIKEVIDCLCKILEYFTPKFSNMTSSGSKASLTVRGWFLYNLLLKIFQNDPKRPGFQ